MHDPVHEIPDHRFSVERFKTFLLILTHKSIHAQTCNVHVMMSDPKEGMTRECYSNTSLLLPLEAQRIHALR